MSEATAVSWTYDHVGLSVADLDGAVAFYESAFGFHDDYRFELPEAETRVAMLSHPSGARIELFERAGSAPEDRPDPHRALERQGYGHWALWSDDVPALFESLTAAGAVGVWAPKVGPSGGMMAFVSDLEGNLIELLQVRDDRDG
ncbi:MAG: VOC family protein [Solirubrobacterales bacterium]